MLASAEVPELAAGCAKPDAPLLHLAYRCPGFSGAEAKQLIEPRPFRQLLFGAGPSPPTPEAAPIAINNGSPATSRRVCVVAPPDNNDGSKGAGGRPARRAPTRVADPSHVPPASTTGNTPANSVASASPSRTALGGANRALGAAAPNGVRIVIPVFQRRYCWGTDLAASWFRDVSRKATTLAAADAAATGVSAATDAPTSSSKQVQPITASLRFALRCRSATKSDLISAHGVGKVVFRAVPDPFGSSPVGSHDDDAERLDSAPSHPSNAPTPPDPCLEPRVCLYCIDGQQRTTTASLFLIALRDAVLSIRIAAIQQWKRLQPAARFLADAASGARAMTASTPPRSSPLEATSFVSGGSTTSAISLLRRRLHDVILACDVAIETLHRALFMSSPPSLLPGEGQGAKQEVRRREAAATTPPFSCRPLLARLRRDRRGDDEGDSSDQRATTMAHSSPAAKANADVEDHDDDLSSRHDGGSFECVRLYPSHADRAPYMAVLTAGMLAAEQLSERVIVSEEELTVMANVAEESSGSAAETEEQSTMPMVEVEQSGGACPEPPSPCPEPPSQGRGAGGSFWSWVDRFERHGASGVGGGVGVDDEADVSLLRSRPCRNKRYFDRRVADLLATLASSSRGISDGTFDDPTTLWHRQLLALAHLCVAQLDSVYYMHIEALNEINLAQVFLWLQEKSLFGMGALLYNPTPGVAFHATDLIRNLLLAPSANCLISTQERMHRAWFDGLERRVREDHRKTTTTRMMAAPNGATTERPVGSSTDSDDAEDNVIADLMDAVMARFLAVNKPSIQSKLEELVAAMPTTQTKTKKNEKGDDGSAPTRDKGGGKAFPSSGEPLPRGIALYARFLSWHEEQQKAKCQSHRTTDGDEAIGNGSSTSSTSPLVQAEMVAEDRHPSCEAGASSSVAAEEEQQFNAVVAKIRDFCDSVFLLP